MKRYASSFIVHISAFALLLAVGNSASAQWIIDGRHVQSLQIEVSDPNAALKDGSNIGDDADAFRAAIKAAPNFGVNVVYYGTTPVARWVALSNGIALEVWSESRQLWVRQAEWRED